MSIPKTMNDIILKTLLISQTSTKYNFRMINPNRAIPTIGKPLSCFLNPK